MSLGAETCEEAAPACDGGGVLAWVWLHSGNRRWFSHLADEVSEALAEAKARFCCLGEEPIKRRTPPAIEDRAWSVANPLALLNDSVLPSSQPLYIFSQAARTKCLTIDGA